MSIVYGCEKGKPLTVKSPLSLEVQSDSQDTPVPAENEATTFYVLKQGKDGKVIREDFDKQKVRVRINQIVSNNFPEIQLLVSLSTPEGYPIELSNINAFSVVDGGRDVAHSGAWHVAKRKDSEFVIPLSIVLALDKSGSMAFDGKGKASIDEQPLSYAKSSAVTFIKQLRVLDEARVLAFDGYIYDLGENENAIEGVEKLVPSGYTALYGALYRSLLALQNKMGGKVVILLTDGKNDLRPNTGSSQEIRLIKLSTGLDLADRLSIPVFTIGFGAGHDSEMLQKIALATHSLYFNTTDKTQLMHLYDNIRHVIDNQYMITYQTKSLQKSTEVTVKIPGHSDTRTYHPHPGLLEKAMQTENQLRELGQRTLHYQKLFGEYSRRLDEVEQKDKTLNAFLARIKVHHEDIEREKQSFLELQQYFSSLNEHLQSKKQAVALSLSAINSQIDGQQSRLNRSLVQLQQYQTILDRKQREIEQGAESFLRKEALLREKTKDLQDKQQDLSIRRIILGRDTGGARFEIERLLKLRDVIQAQQAQLRTQFDTLNKSRDILNMQKEKIAQQQHRLDQFNKELKDLEHKLMQDKAATQMEREKIQVFLEELNEKRKDLEGFQHDLTGFLEQTTKEFQTLKKKGVLKLPFEVSQEKSQ